jgi:flavin reductase (DIM6/NTAB) family NADH-FMN oxidoreductase RutF
MIYPLPAMLVSCGASPEEYNLFTAAWVGTICSDPALCYVSIRPERHSHGIVERNMAFTLNLTNRDLARATDWCGVRSGRDYDKFKETMLSPYTSEFMDTPAIDQSPVNIYCKTKKIERLGSHDMFLAEVVGVTVDEAYMDEKGKFDLEATKLITYSHGEYFALGKKLGKFGYSVKKK